MQKQFLEAPAPPDLRGSGLNVGIIVARFNWPITGSLLALAYEELVRLDVAPEQITVVHAPGAYELATIAQAMLSTPHHYDVLICIGCVMKGATRHDVLVGDAATQGIQRVALDTGIPIIFGVLCAENTQQAQERIPRGIEFAQAAIEMACTVQQLKYRNRQ
ncbi:6,7-dimethyl-8-ribityllumazine synthase [Dictyobacter alpinus]|uniref:6,7-dimethyl-8-ribityllumazine synthase n=1 Tax=Dictyobacter alpinus TaxID=2014873 RepID=A0A402BBB6_9CHLR|nr:6,7-dimethyl-8-ribityllumazine synthase [Dictyobacter alpinus]GCE28634.1 6,7-dimethyl-8-ribityllumazine synthase [Dictyobacter alpinus]